MTDVHAAAGRGGRREREVSGEHVTWRKGARTLERLHGRERERLGERNAAAHAVPLGREGDIGGHEVVRRGELGVFELVLVLVALLFGFARRGVELLADELEDAREGGLYVLLRRVTREGHVHDAR